MFGGGGEFRLQALCKRFFFGECAGGGFGGILGGFDGFLEHGDIAFQRGAVFRVFGGLVGGGGELSAERGDGVAQFSLATPLDDNQRGEQEAADGVDDDECAGSHSVFGFEAYFLDTRIAHGIEHAEHLFVAGLFISGNEDAGRADGGEGFQAICYF